MFVGVLFLFAVVSANSSCGFCSSSSSVIHAETLIVACSPLKAPEPQVGEGLQFGKTRVYKNCQVFYESGTNSECSKFLPTLSSSSSSSYSSSVSSSVPVHVVASREEDYNEQGEFVSDGPELCPPLLPESTSSYSRVKGRCENGIVYLDPCSTVSDASDALRKRGSSLRRQAFRSGVVLPVMVQYAVPPRAVPLAVPIIHTNSISQVQLGDWKYFPAEMRDVVDKYEAASVSNNALSFRLFQRDAHIASENKHRVTFSGSYFIPAAATSDGFLARATINLNNVIKASANAFGGYSSAGLSMTLSVASKRDRSSPSWLNPIDHCRGQIDVAKREFGAFSAGAGFNEKIYPNGEYSISCEGPAFNSASPVELWIGVTLEHWAAAGGLAGAVIQENSGQIAADKVVISHRSLVQTASGSYTAPLQPTVPRAASMIAVVLTEPRIEHGIDLPGSDLRVLDVPANDALNACRESCRATSNCKAFTLVKATNKCWLKNSIPVGRPDSCCVSGRKN